MPSKFTKEEFVKAGIKVRACAKSEASATIAYGVANNSRQCYQCEQQHQILTSGKYHTNPNLGKTTAGRGVAGVAHVHYSIDRRIDYSTAIALDIIPIIQGDTLHELSAQSWGQLTCCTGKHLHRKA